MARTIYKYEIAPDILLPMPKGARLLTVQMQGDTPCLWAEVDPVAPVVQRDLHIYGTGHPLPDDMSGLTYLCTFQQGPFVWHVYDGGEC